MKTFISTLKFAFIGVFTLSVIACSNDDDNNDTPPPMEELTIYETAVASADLTILVEALERTGLDAVLDQPGAYTVLAPTNAAFEGVDLSAISDEDLTNLLLNHVIAAEVYAGDLMTGYANTVATGPDDNAISLYVNLDGGPVFNGMASPTTTDIEASNGVIHLINAPLPIPSVVDHALANPNFSTLVAAILRFEDQYADLLASDAAAPYTVFAPTNDAFALLLEDLGATSLDDIDDATLEAVLTYHVILGANVQSSQITDGAMVATANGAELTFSTTDGVQITDGTEDVTNVLTADVQAGNGVIHAIDKVLLPPAPAQ